MCSAPPWPCWFWLSVLWYGWKAISVKRTKKNQQMLSWIQLPNEQRHHSALSVTFTLDGQLLIQASLLNLWNSFSSQPVLCICIAQIHECVWHLQCLRPEQTCCRNLNKCTQCLHWHKKETRSPISFSPITCFSSKAYQPILLISLAKLSLKNSYEYLSQSCHGSIRLVLKDWLPVSSLHSLKASLSLFALLPALSVCFSNLQLFLVLPSLRQT